MQKVYDILGKDTDTWVELVHTLPTQDMDKHVAQAARTSFAGDASEDPEKNAKLLDYLMRNKHTSPFEQAVFQFRIKAPVVVWWQFVRHRTGRFNLQSGRYMDFPEDEFYVPHVWRLQSKDNKQGSSGEMSASRNALYSAAFSQWAQAGQKLYQQALTEGMAKEQARFFLPGWNLLYVGVVQFDAHNLMHFLELRMDSHAQEEIRRYANSMYAIFAEAMPVTAALFRKYRLKENKEG